MILVLGGDKDRELAAADLARRDGLPVVVSGGSNPEYAHWIFEEREGLPSHQVQLDYRARDTLSNFTSLVDDLRRARIRHALLVTSRDHMDRALLVGRIVAGSRGIHLTPVPVPCGSREEWIVTWSLEPQSTSMPPSQPESAMLVSVTVASMVSTTTFAPSPGFDGVAHALPPAPELADHRPRPSGALRKPS
jgi:uncharacterized SAM-binding protein YcdF (DUF218 family)